MEITRVIDNSGYLQRLIWNTCSWKPWLNEVIQGFDGSLAHSQEQQLEHLLDQFSWPMVTVDLPLMAATEPKQIGVSHHSK